MLQRTLSHHCSLATGGGTIIVKGMESFDVATSIPWPAKETTAAAAAAASSTSSTSSAATATHTSTPSRRSPYAVLRSLRTPADTCASNLLASPSCDAGEGRKAVPCACAALLYPSFAASSSASAPPQGEAEMAERHAVLSFVHALRLSGAEHLLLDGASRGPYEQLVGETVLQHARLANLCADPSSLFGGEAGAAVAWEARMLLTAEESNRLKWFREESEDLTRFYGRAPSLRVLYVMSALVEATTAAGAAAPPPPPTKDDLTQVLDRMAAAKAELQMADLAALYLLGVANKALGNTVVRHLLSHLKQLTSRTEGATLEETLRILLSILLFWESSQRLLADATPGTAAALSAKPPVELLNAASEVSVLVGPLLKKDLAAATTASESSPHASLRQLTARVLQGLEEDVLRLAAQCDVPVDNALLLDVVTWLLREAPHSRSCSVHFGRLVSRRPAEASLALERNGLLSRHTIDLERVVHTVLPLLEDCGDEDFYAIALRDVLSGLEDRLRRGRHAFTPKDMKLLAELGTHLFSNSPESMHSSFDATARGQMEELQVMDGSPLSLCVASYHSIREMLEGLLRDHRRVQRQLEEQIRSIGLPGLGPEVKTKASRRQKHVAAAAAAAAAATAADASATAATETKKGEHKGREEARMPVPPNLRHRFLVFLEDLVKMEVDEDDASNHKPLVISSELFSFINQHVPVPNIQDEYRRKIFLLVNVAEDPETVQRRQQAQQAEKRHKASAKGEAAEEPEPAPADASNTPEEIPAELRFLVSSLPLTLSPWASVMILREVVAESAGNNPRYTYVLNAAIDLQLPISTTRSRIATTYNMWRFLSTQSHKLSLKEGLIMKKRCIINLPLSYILSSYWSLLAWISVAGVTLLNIIGIDFESQLVANSLFQKFAPYEELDLQDGEARVWQREAAAELASDYLGQDEIARRHRRQRGSTTEVFLSSASYLFLGYDDQRRPLTVVPLSSSPRDDSGSRTAEEYGCATAVLRELSLHVPFPFFVDVERLLPTDLVTARVAERIRRVSFNNTWFGPRVFISLFPLGRQFTERSLVSHTCAQANLTRRRVTFLFYIHAGVPVTPNFLKGLQDSIMAESANLVVVVHEDSLRQGGITPENMQSILSAATGSQGRVLPCSKQLYEAEEMLHRSGQSDDSSKIKKLSSREAKARLKQQQQQQQQLEAALSPYALYYGLQAQRQREAKARGDEASSRSYWDTTVRFVSNPVRFLTNTVMREGSSIDSGNNSSNQDDGTAADTTEASSPSTSADTDASPSLPQTALSQTRTVISVPFTVLQETVTAVQTAMMSDSRCHTANESPHKLSLDSGAVAARGAADATKNGNTVTSTTSTPPSQNHQHHDHSSAAATDANTPTAAAAALEEEEEGDPALWRRVTQRALQVAREELAAYGTAAGSFAREWERLAVGASTFDTKCLAAADHFAPGRAAVWRRSHDGEDGGSSAAPSARHEWSALGHHDGGGVLQSVCTCLQAHYRRRARESARQQEVAEQQEQQEA